MFANSLSRTGLVLVTAGTLALGACSTNAGTDDSTGDNATISYAFSQEIETYNQSTSGGAATQNTVPLNRVLPGFWRYAPDGTIQPDTDFGSYQKVSDDPLTVEYTFNDAAVWSDGDPVDCDDAYLAYIANSGLYEQFDSASTTGYDLISDFSCADGDKKFTVTFSQPFADWEGLFGTFMPAQVLEANTDIPDFVAAAQAGDATAAMATAGEFWSTGWVFQPGVLPDEALIPSAGPYKLSSWEAGQSLTLQANDQWWGAAPKADTVVIRLVSDDAQAQALQNGDIQVTNPDPDPDILSDLQDQGDSITIQEGDQFIFEHLDLNFASTVWADPRVRQAFALCVPRQQIVDNLIKPQNANAVVLNSSYLFPFQPHYDEVTAAAVGTKYDEVNIEQAKQLLQQAGNATPTVRLGFVAGNQRRADAFTLIQASCGDAGFNIVDISSPTFSDDGGELLSGNFDAAMFAWAGSALVTGASSLYSSDGGDNYGKYSNAAVDAAISQLNVTPNRDDQISLITQIETNMWSDLATIPLYAFPGLAAWSNDINGVVFNGSQAGLTWNMDEWAR